MGSKWALFWGRPAFPPELVEPGSWELRYYRFLEAAPYVLLAVSTVLSQATTAPSIRERLTVIGIAALTAGWVYVMYTRSPRGWRERTAPMLVYFAGLLAFTWALESHSAFFIAFAITGFLQAFFLLPVVLAFIATAATSSVLYLAAPDSGFRNPAALPALAFIVVLQTAATGGGSFMGSKISEQHSRQLRLLADLKAAQEENQGLQVQVLAQARAAGVLDERQRLAREIHDTLAQGLTGIVTQLEAAEVEHLRSEVWRAHVARANALARESLREARRSLHALRPEPLEGSRLADAIADMARRWSETAAVDLTLETTGEPVPLLTELEVTLFRVAQEALANVARHASASRVGLTISYMDDVVLLDVRDNGAGFTPGETNGSGFGLRAMEQRLRLVGGTLAIESEVGAGTAVSASVPAIPVDPPPRLRGDPGEGGR